MAVGSWGSLEKTMPRVLRRLASALVAADHFGNPFHIARKRLFGKPSDLMAVVDRATGVRCVCNLGSHHMFADTWYSRVYDVPGVPIRPGDVVLDIGANQGFFTCYAAQKGVNVHAFEPVPELCERLRLNVARNGFSDRVTVAQCAMSDKRGQVDLLVSASLGGAQSTILPEFAKNANVPVSRHISVQCTTLPDVLEQCSVQSIRLCKIDVEGAEMSILRTLAPSHLARIQSFVLEYHPDAYDVRALMNLVIDWGTHQASFMDNRPYAGNILRLVSNEVLRSIGGSEPAAQSLRLS